MFASSSNVLRVNSWPPELIQDSFGFNPHQISKISHLSWCNDNSYMAVLQEGQRPQILATKNLNNIRTIHTIAYNDVTSLAFKNGTKKHLAMGMKSGDVVIYDTKARFISKNFTKLVTPIDVLEFSYDDTQLAALCEDAVVVFNTNGNEEISNEYKENSRCSSVKFHPVTSSRLAVGCCNGYVTLWDANVSSKIYNCQLHSHNVTGLSLSKCGNFLISVGRDHKICLTDLNSGECQFRINLNVPVNALDLRYDDKIIAVGLEDGSVYVYDMNFTVQPLLCLRKHNTPVNAISFAHQSQDMMENESFVSSLTSIQDHVSEMKMTSPKTGLTSNSDHLDKLKRDIMKSMKIQVEDLENQLKQHCQKFQAFINNEFKMINDILKDKWEVFGAGDVNKALQDTQSEYCEPSK